MIISRSLHVAANGVISFFLMAMCGLPRWLSDKRIHLLISRRHRFDPWVGRILWRRKWQPTPAFVPGKSHGQRILVGYSPRGHKRVGHNLAAKQQQQYSVVCVCVCVCVCICVYIYISHLPYPFLC